MSDNIQWQGATVEVQARLIPRLLWTTADIEVFVDGQCVLHTGGQIKFRGSQTAHFIHAGAKHWTELSWGFGWLRSVPYSLRMDGNPVAEGRVRVRNWPLGFITPVLIAATMMRIHNILQHAPKK